MAVKAVAERGSGYQNQAPITHLSRDLTLLFALWLPGNQISRLRTVSKYFTWVVRNDDENLWKRLCQQEFPSRTAPSNIPAHLHYQHRFKTEQNWRKGRYTYARLNARFDRQRFLSLIENRLLCLAPGNSLQVFDLKAPSVVKELEGGDHRNCDSMECTEDNDLAIVEFDFTYSAYTIVWDKTSGERLRDLEDCTLHVDPMGIFFLSEQASCVSFWDRKTHEVRRLISNNNGADFLKLDGSLLFTAISSGIVKCWNKSDGMFVRQFGAGQEGKVKNVILHKNILFCLHENGIINAWNKEEATLLRQMVSGQEGEVRQVVDNDLLFCLFDNSTIYAWKKEDASLAYKLTAPEGKIEWIYVDGEVIMATCRSDDPKKYSIACWNKASGDFLFQIELRVFKPYLHADRLVCIPQPTNVPHTEYLGSIEVRDKYTGVLVTTCRTGERKFIEIIHIDNHRIFSRINQVLKIWDIHTGSLLFSLENIKKFKILEDRMIIAYADGNIDVCDFSAVPEIPFPHQGQLPTPPKPSLP